MTGILASELEMHALQRGRALAHDEAARLRFADERRRLDGRMLGEELAGLLADAVHEIHDARRNARFRHDLGEQRGGERAPLRRLVHHRATGRERRRDLPRGEHERRVPRRDDRHRPDGLAHRVVHVLGGRQRQTIRGAGRAIGEEAEILGGAQRRAAHETQRLAGIHAFDERDLLAPRFDEVRHLVQDRAALLARLRAPRGKCVLRSGGGGVHVPLIARGTPG